MKNLSKFFKPEIIFVVISLLFGIVFSIAIPYGAGFDEETHLVRIFDISGGNLIPNRPTSDGNYTFSEFYSLSYQRRLIQTPATDQFSTTSLTIKPNWQNMSGGHTESTYLPIMFFPEAVIAGLGWRVLNLPILPVIFLIRIIGLLVYISLSYFAIRLLPMGKWVITILSLTPMAIFQASTINGDHFTIAVSSLYIAAVLNIFHKVEPLKWKDAILVSCCSLLLGFAKPGTIILLPLLLILVKRRSSSKKIPLLILFSVVISIVISLYWSSLAVLFTTYLPSGATRADQIKLILNNFSDFIVVFIKGSFQLLPRYFSDWVAEYGYWVGKVPWPVYLFFVLSLIFSFLTEKKNYAIKKEYRLFLFLLGFICLGIMAAIKIIWIYTPGQINVDTQGRYFLPFVPLVFFSFLGLINTKPSWQTKAMVGCTALIFATLFFYGIGLFRTYYTTCVFPVSSSTPCTLPIYRNLDTDHPIKVPLEKGKVISQTFSPRCEVINAIDVQTMDSAHFSKGTLFIEVYDPAGKLIGKSSIDLNSSEKINKIHFILSNISVKNQSGYSFNLTINTKDSSTINLWGIPNDIYQDGQLLIDKRPMQNASDLYFRYECSSQ